MFLFLWHNREHPAFLGGRWVRVWAKRIINMPALYRNAWALARLRSRGARIGNGSIIIPGRFSNLRNLSVGENSFIGRVAMQLQSKITIGSHVCINDGVRLITASHDVRDAHWPMTSAPITIGDYAWIATSATILPGVTIGRGAVVGACAVVSSDVPDHAVAVGNPARIRENIRPETLQYNPVRSLALFEAWLGPARVQPVIAGEMAALKSK